MGISWHVISTSADSACPRIRIRQPFRRTNRLRLLPTQLKRPLRPGPVVIGSRQSREDEVVRLRGARRRVGPHDCWQPVEQPNYDYTETGFYILP